MKPHFFLPLATYPEPSSEAVASSAVLMAARFEASLHAVAFNPAIPQVSNALSKLLLDTPQMIRDAESSGRRHGKQLLEAVTSNAKEAGVEVTTGEVAAPVAALGEAACEQARYFDLALVGWEAGNQTSRMLAEAIIFGAGRPTVILPNISSIGAIEHVAIAWDGSRVAARAVADARPFLEKASRISVITVINEKKLRDNGAAEKLAEGLRQRGLAAEAAPTQIGNSSIGVTLQETATSLEAGLLVMGGYGHSRVRDFVLGGATEGILSDLRLPVLLSH